MHKMGDRQGIAIAVGNSGNVHTRRGEYAEALKCYRQAASEHRQIGYRYGLCYWLEATAALLLRLVAGDGSHRPSEQMPTYLPEYVPEAEDDTWRAMSLRAAREQAEECVAISEALGTPDMLLSGRILLERIRATEGDVETAGEMLGMLLEQASDIERRAELHYWLWSFSRVSPGDNGNESEVHRNESLRHYSQLLEKTPKHDYRKRIEELQKSSQF
jgi:tetratricopeptide (TPR) repeat protein